MRTSAPAPVPAPRPLGETGESGATTKTVPRPVDELDTDLLELVIVLADSKPATTAQLVTTVDGSRIAAIVEHHSRVVRGMLESRVESLLGSISGGNFSRRRLRTLRSSMPFKTATTGYIVLCLLRDFEADVVPVPRWPACVEPGCQLPAWFRHRCFGCYIETGKRPGAVFNHLSRFVHSVEVQPNPTSPKALERHYFMVPEQCMRMATGVYFNEAKKRMLYSMRHEPHAVKMTDILTASQDLHNLANAHKRAKESWLTSLLCEHASLWNYGPLYTTIALNLLMLTLLQAPVSDVAPGCRAAGNSSGPAECVDYSSKRVLQSPDFHDHPLVVRLLLSILGVMHLGFAILSFCSFLEMRIDPSKLQRCDDEKRKAITNMP